MSKSGLSIPESAGFGVLGATIGFVTCSLVGNDGAAHAGIGMVVGAILVIGLGHLPLQRALRAFNRTTRTAPAPANRAASR